MVRQTDLTHVYSRLQELNEKIDYNTNLLNNILKIINNDVNKKCDKTNEHDKFVENVRDAVKDDTNKDIKT